MSDSKRVRQLVWLNAACVASMLLVFFYHRWLGRIEFLRWSAMRQEKLGQLGTTLRRFAAANGGVLPDTEGDLVRLGIIKEGELDFLDPNLGVRVIRRYNATPSIEYSGAIVVIIEFYEPPNDRIGILHLDGHSTYIHNLDALVRKDNQLRKSNGLDAVNWSF